jgi:hypothetical protein
MKNISLRRFLAAKYPEGTIPLAKQTGRTASRSSNTATVAAPLPAHTTLSSGHIYSGFLSFSGLENQEYRRRDPLYWPCNTLNPQRLELRWQTAVAR